MDKIAKSKVRLLLEHAFFASVACKLPFIRDDTIYPPTMCTNGEWVRYHGKYVEERSVGQVLFAICHEVLHCAFLHMYRMDGRDPVAWNVATDVVINQHLVEDRIGERPKDAIYEPSLFSRGGGTAEGVYNVLRNTAEGQALLARCKPFDSIVDAGKTGAAKTDAEQDMRVTIAQAAAVARACKQMGKAIDRLVGEVLKPKASWRDILRRFLTQKVKITRSYARPKRRFISEDMYLPGMTGKVLGRIAVAVDCSGSIDKASLSRFAAELNAIKTDMQPAALHVVYFHHEVTKHNVFERSDELVLEPSGCGGTAFSPIFRFLAEQDIVPECCIVLTDLECDDFGGEPDYPVLWVSTRPGKAPWGEVVLMSAAGR